MTSYTVCETCGETFTVCRDCLEVFCGCDREAAQQAARAAIDSECDRLAEEAAVSTDEGGGGEYPW